MRPPQAFRLASLIGTILATLGTAACGRDGGSSEACGPIRREALDAAYLVHVLGDDTPVQYTSNPPTSGPHQPTPAIGGVVDEPITEPIQIGVLERGDVLIQYLPSIDDDDRVLLEGLAGERVTVAPNPDLDDEIVATGWLYKRSCASVDLGELQEFIDGRIGKGPEG